VGNVGSTPLQVLPELDSRPACFASFLLVGNECITYFVWKN